MQIKIFWLINCGTSETGVLYFKRRRGAKLMNGSIVVIDESVQYLSVLVNNIRLV